MYDLYGWINSKLEFADCDAIHTSHWDFVDTHFEFFNVSKETFDLLYSGDYSLYDIAMMNGGIRVTGYDNVMWFEGQDKVLADPYILQKLKDLAEKSGCEFIFEPRKIS